LLAAAFPVVFWRPPVPLCLGAASGLQVAARARALRFGLRGVGAACRISGFGLGDDLAACVGLCADSKAALRCIGRKERVTAALCGAGTVGTCAVVGLSAWMGSDVSVCAASGCVAGPATKRSVQFEKSDHRRKTRCLV